ncbi:transposon Ty3-G Gag-Pol polyprotein [Trichonephila clavipes]|nr:transposon Ty3-G Gag-Pol polyprotein [Trichonephila clavipes]
MWTPLIMPGGALHQVVDSELQPLAFFSRKLTSEKSYSAYDRELPLLSILSDTICWKRQCLLTTSPSLMLLGKKVTTPRQSVNFISQFTNIVHIPGSDNIAADVLLVFLQSPSQVKLTMTVLLRHNRLIRASHPNSIWKFLGTQKAGSLSPRSSKLLANYLVFRSVVQLYTTHQANGMIEELHRPLKSAIKCHATERWTEVLPIILLGLRASLKEDILCTPAELVFGTTIRV